MRLSLDGHRFQAFAPPYQSLQPLDDPRSLPSTGIPPRGVALLWNLRHDDWGRGFIAAKERPPGVALIAVLPPAGELGDAPRLLELLERCRIHSVLPHVQEMEPEELVAVIRRFPSGFAVEVADYLHWRGMELDLDTRRLVRKTLELSENLRTVAGLARALYVSRRALGRRFASRGIPVPSHWLHLGRILRAAIRLQAGGATLFSVACDLGYSDGFALSNQMYRLTGLRPSLMRSCFGWEWIAEAWLRREAAQGNLSPFLQRALFPDPSILHQAPFEETSTEDEELLHQRYRLRVAEVGVRGSTTRYMSSPAGQGG